MPFDPDQYLAGSDAPKSGGFDPDAYLSDKPASNNVSRETSPAKQKTVPERLMDAFSDAPDTTYGTILPFSRNEKTGETSLAVPEIIRSPMRGVADMAARAIYPQAAMQAKTTPDEAAALLAFGGIKSPVDRMSPAVEADVAARQPLKNALNEDKLRTKADTVIARRLGQDIEGGGITAQDVMDRMNAAQAQGKPMTLLDVGGENLQALGGNVARQPGPGRNMLRGFLETRDAAAEDRVTADVDKYVATGSMKQTADSLLKSRSAAAAPLYDEAFKANQAVESPALNRILKTPAGKSALAQARVKMQNDMTLLAKPDAELTEQAREVGQNTPRGVGVGLKLRTWDYVKRALDDQIGTAQRAGEKDNARILTGLKQDLVRELDKADVTAQEGPNSVKPEGGAYARARAAYSSTSESLEALQAGRDIFKASPEENAETVAKLSPNDREFYRLGAADIIKERIQKTGIGGDEAKAIIKNSRTKAQLRPLFDSEDQFNKFIDSVTAESKMFSTQRKVIGGSQTAERVAEDQFGSNLDLAGNLVGGLRHAVSGNMLGAARNFLRAKRDLGLRANPQLNTEIARRLTDPTLSLSPRNALRQFVP